MMNMAVSELGEEADHMEVVSMVEKWNDVRLD
jgi:hypothetical protein